MPTSDLLARALEVLQACLPPGWEAQRQPDDLSDDVDAVLQIASRHGSVRVVVEIRATVAPKDVTAIVRQARLLNRVAGNTPVLVVAPWISPRTRTSLTDSGINYLDLTGAVRLSSDYPALFIYRENQVRGPARPRSTPTLKGPNAGRLVRLLADVKPPYGVRELALHAGVTAGYVSRLLDMLAAEEIVERDHRGRVNLVDWQELLRRRAESYSVFGANRSRRFVAPNGPGYALEMAGDSPARRHGLWLTGSFPVERVVAVAPPTLLVVYATNDSRPFIESAGLLPSEAGANVIILTPYDSVVVEPRWPNPQPIPPRIPVVGASQLALDCLTGVGRMPSEGEAFLKWMATHEAEWRYSTLADLAPQTNQT